MSDAAPSDDAERRDEEMKQMIAMMLDQVSANVQAMSESVLAKLDQMGERVASLEGAIQEMEKQQKEQEQEDKE